jgi:predicted PhzF superfamily epimerase YddE/YHI9
MSETYEFVQLDVFTRTPRTGNALAISHRRARDASDQPSSRLRLGKRCEFSVRLFQLIVGQAHRSQECIPARVVVEIR